MRFLKILATAGFMLFINLSLFADTPIHTGGNLDSDCSIAYNSTNDEYLAVWNKSGDNITTSVYAQRLDKSGTPIGNPVSISQNSSHPVVAYNPKTNEYLVVFATIIAITGNVIYGLRLDASGSQITGSGGVLMKQAGDPKIVYNFLDDSYLLTGALLYDSGTPDLCNIKIYTRKISSAGQPVGTTQLIRDEGNGLCADGARYSIAYAPVTSTETPQGRYLLVINGNSGFGLTMLDDNGAIVSEVFDSQSGTVVDDHVPFQTSKVGTAYNADIAYGNWEGEQVFMVVWGDRDQQFGSQEWTGIWAGIVNATQIKFDAHSGVSNTVFPVSRIYYHWATTEYAKSWKPVVAYNQIADKFMIAWRETPTTNPNNNTKVNHIRANAVNSPAVPPSDFPPNNVVLSAVTGNEDPKKPVIAVNTKNANALVVWQDARNSATSDIDIYGSLYAITPLKSPKLTVTSPNGGELWGPGFDKYITWTSQGLSNPIKIEYSTNGGISYKTIVASTPNYGGYKWTVPNEPSANCLVKISDATNGSPSDVSDAKFEIGYMTMTFVVTNTNDNGAGSFRQMLIDANNNLGKDTIYFNIPGNTKHTISPASQLPVITDPVVIDGYSQPGASPSTKPITAGSNAVLMIELNFNNTSAGVDGLNITAGNSTVQGLVINSFYGNGIKLETKGGNTIAGNFIGTDVTGIVGKPLAKIEFTWGVIIHNSANNVIGGTTASARNVISGSGNGIDIVGNGASNNKVQGNLIGTDKTGTAVLGNLEMGVEINNGSKNLIGGTVSGARNIITGNGISSSNSVIPGVGINIQGVSATGNFIQGNFIGTDITGKTSLNNSAQTGIYIAGNNNTIGGATIAARNIISGNSWSASGVDGGTGIRVIGDSNVVQGNFIGTDLTGTTDIGNGTGIIINGSDNMIGGMASGMGNIIAFNKSYGISVSVLSVSEKSINNTIFSNSIFSNYMIGINLGAGGLVTANDVGDGDTGPNNLQNFPVIISATSGGGSTTVDGTLNSTANVAFRLEFFSNKICDPSGYGEGQTLLGSTNVTTDASGNASFKTTFPVSVPNGYFITATATDARNNTSEFSKCLAVKSNNTSSGAKAFQVMDDLLNCGNSTVLNITQNITIEAWVKADVSQGNGRYGRIADKYLYTEQTGYSLNMVPDSYVIKFEFWGMDGALYSCDGITPINDEIWHHVAATYDGATIKVYLDGNLENKSDIGKVNIKPSSNNFTIGSNFDGISWQPIYAAIDEVRSWNIARSQSQLQTTMNDTLPPAYYSSLDSGLVGYWRFDVFEDLGINNDGADDIRDFAYYHNHGDSEGDPKLVSSGALVSVNYNDLIGSEIPQQYNLFQNYPNPFNPTTKIRYSIPVGTKRAVSVQLKVYDILGKEVATLVNEQQRPGNYEVTFISVKTHRHASLSSGIYFYQFQAGDFIQTKKMIIIK